MGMCSLILGSVFNVIALNIGNQFLVASTCSLSIIFNTFMSVFLLKEKFYPSDSLSLVLIATGCTMFMLEGKASDNHYTDAQLQAIYIRPTSIIFLSIVLLFVIFSYSVEILLVKKLHRLR